MLREENGGEKKEFCYIHTDSWENILSLHLILASKGCAAWALPWLLEALQEVAQPILSLQ